ncbi:MAG: anthranilate synthase component [Actinomycetota bacterium]|jgi:anthranilate synthase component 1|nr:anthranilate synthase component [Actinomycetota bacterium]
MTDFSGASEPDLAGFREFARHRRVIPVVRRLLADGVTAVGLFEVLCQDRAGTFLLESAEQGRNWSRYSFIGVRCAAMLTQRDGEAVWLGRAPRGVPEGGSAVEALRDTVDLLRTDPLPGLPPLTGGLVGYLTYDAVRSWERVPDDNPDELGIPDVGFLLATDLAVLDHADGSVLLVANAINYDASDDGVDEAWRDAVARLDRMESELTAPHTIGIATYDASAPIEVRSSTSRDDYLQQVEQAKEYIRSGDAFQVVLSQRFSTPCSASAFDVYRILRATNPSPYMYLIRVPEDDGGDPDQYGGALPERVAFDIVGSSPEALVTVTSGHCVLHPIAGTRPRGSSAEEDAALAEELSKDVKERAEHVMLVDLARNDLGRVSEPGSVSVVDFMSVERYSHVMHLVSTVTGTLADGRTAYDVLAATFPAGTLSGAPKPRAMAIIDELEPLRRGLYGGCVGYFDFAGNLDAAIAIRTALIKDGTAYVQAGAGLVADSVPATEADECSNKAAAVLRAIAAAHTLAEARSGGTGGRG